MQLLHGDENTAAVLKNKFDKTFWSRLKKTSRFLTESKNVTLLPAALQVILIHLNIPMLMFFWRGHSLFSQLFMFILRAVANVTLSNMCFPFCLVFRQFPRVATEHNDVHMIKEELQRFYSSHDVSRRKVV